MKIVGCDLHTRYQQVAMLDEETGELIERCLEHGNGEAQEFYRGLSEPVRCGAYNALSGGAGSKWQPLSRATQCEVAVSRAEVARGDMGNHV